MRPALRLVMVAAAAIALSASGAAAAHAASVAYVDDGSVWLASLDGARKARLAAPVVNGDGDTEKWLDVAQSDGGRIVGVRNKPGRIANFSWFKIWEPDGTSTVEGPLNAPPGWTLYIYPLGFDITADGKHLVYGYSNSSSCCPITYDRGVYVRPATNSVLAPLVTGSQTHPSLLGDRMIALEDSSSPSIVNVQGSGPGNPYTPAFTPWLDASGVGLELQKVDVAANAKLAALQFQAYSGGEQTVGKIAVLAIQGVDQAPAFPAAVDCFLPAAGIATDVSLSQDATMIAWHDDGGLKVAGAPTTAADPCALPAAPVTISATGGHPSIGPADVGTFLPAPPPGGGTQPGPGATTPGPGATTPGTTPPGATTPGGGASGLVVTLPPKATAKALAAAGLKVTVKAAGAGAVSISATVPAKRLGRKGKPIVVATGKATARRAGTVSVRLRLTAAGRRGARRLKGARLTLRVTQGPRAATKVITLR